MALFGLLNVGTLLNMFPEPVRSVLPRSRRVQPCPGGARIELRTIGGPRTERRARELEERLKAVGVSRAEVNGALGCVFVACDVTTDDMDKLVAVVDELDEDGDGSPAPARDGVEQQDRSVVSLGLHLAGTGLALAGRLARVPRLSAAVPGLLSLAEHTPLVRRELEERIGKPGADAMIAMTRVASHTLAMRPMSLLIDSVAAAGRYVDSRAGLKAWEQREEQFATVTGAYRHTRAA
ncbi:cation-translocating P-type ATPase, partial [Nonomuraea sp. NPDC003201]